MEKKMIIEGMTCNHCKMRVEKVLKGLPGVASAEVDLESKSALIKSEVELSAEALTAAVTDAGYDVVSVG